MRGFAGRSLRTRLEPGFQASQRCSQHPHSRQPELTLLRNSHEFSGTGPQGFAIDLYTRITAATRSVPGEGAVDREPPDPFPQAFPPPQSTRSHRACPEPSCHLAFSASSAIQHLLFTTRKIISQGSGLKKKKKPHSIPGLGHRSHFPSSLGLSLYPVPALHPQILSPLPPFQDKSSGSLSPLGGYSGGQGGGEVAVTVKVRIHVTFPATPAGYDSSPKCQ